MDKVKNRQFILIEFWSLLSDSRVSLLYKILAIGLMLGYSLSPFDIIPDVIVPVGWGDDLGAIAIIIFVFVSIARQQVANYESLSDEEKAARKRQESAAPVQIALGCFTLIGSLAFMALIGASITLFAGWLTLNSLLSPFRNFLPWLTEPTTAHVVSSRTLVSSIKPLGQLVSVSAEVAQADIFVSVNTGGLQLCNHSANHVAQGAVEAGVDITQVGEDSVSYDEATNTYTITLPAPSITSCRIEYIRQYELSGGNPTCGIDWDEVRVLGQYEATKLFAQDTIKAGILARAERETTLLMQSFIGALTNGAQVKVVYAAADGTELPPSCQPQLPRGWEFDAEQNAWVKTN